MGLFWCKEFYASACLLLTPQGSVLGLFLSHAPGVYIAHWLLTKEIEMTVTDVGEVLSISFCV